MQKTRIEQVEEIGINPGEPQNGGSLTWNNTTKKYEHINKSNSNHSHAIINSNWNAVEGELGFIENKPTVHDSHEISDITGLSTELGNRISKATSTDNAIVRFNGANGEVQNSGPIISDAGEIIAIAVGQIKTAILGKSNFIGVHGEGLGDESYGVVGTSKYIPSQFCNSEKTVTGVKTVQKFRGDSDHLYGPVEKGYGLKQTYNLPTNSFEPTESYNAEKEAGAIECIWEDVSNDNEFSVLVINLMKGGITAPCAKFTGDGKIYVWNNSSWVEIGSGSFGDYVAKVGDTMAGALEVTTSGTGWALYGHTPLGVAIQGVSEKNIAMSGISNSGSSAIFEQQATLEENTNNSTVIIRRSNSGPFNQTGKLLDLEDNSTVSGTIGDILVELKVLTISKFVIYRNGSFDVPRSSFRYDSQSIGVDTAGDWRTYSDASGYYTEYCTIGNAVKGSGTWVNKHTINI
jgi:hypothetical protein